MVDSGSTHNFISSSLVKKLGLTTETILNFGVQIGGEIIRCNQICRNLAVQMPGLQIIQDYYPFSIKGTYVVLGIKWLASLNIVQANWNKMFMIFFFEWKEVQVTRHSNGGGRSLTPLLCQNRENIRCPNHHRRHTTTALILSHVTQCYPSKHQAISLSVFSKNRDRKPSSRIVNIGIYTPQFKPFCKHCVGAHEERQIHGGSMLITES